MSGSLFSISNDLESLRQSMSRTQYIYKKSHDPTVSKNTIYDEKGGNNFKDPYA